ncbi:hypothetical protein BGW80DRAFT_1332683 [Lactifluus volemus]|nr:hypothetical protein BGW80DRAFT_1332683 [Lactifluus volemus]
MSMTISPTSDSEPSPHAPGVSTFTPHSPFAPPSSDSTDPHNNVDLGVSSDIPLLSASPTSVPNYTVPEITRSSLASPAFPIDEVTADPLPLPSTSTTAIFPPPPDGTTVSRPNTGLAPNDGTVDGIRDPVLRYNMDALAQSQESAMSVPEVATDVLCHPLDVASVSRDIDQQNRGEK